MKKQIAFFDFDGTITIKDTLLEFIKFSKGKVAFYKGFLLNGHYLIGYKAGLISNQFAKEKILSHFFKDATSADFKALCLEFATTELKKLIRPGALNEIAALKARGFDVVIVTASAEDWVKPWTDAMRIELIGTRLELVNDKLTGRISNANCHGNEKVKRITEMYDLDIYEVIYAYGDTPGDKPMLQLAHKSFYKPFRK